MPTPTGKIRHPLCVTNVSPVNFAIYLNADFFLGCREPDLVARNFAKGKFPLRNKNAPAPPAGIQPMAWN
jgi:hypothetical protein